MFFITIRYLFCRYLRNISLIWNCLISLITFKLLMFEYLISYKFQLTNRLNLMNPLLTRIYQSQNKKTSKDSNRVNTTHEQLLVPKLSNKIKLQALATPHQTSRQKPSLNVSYTSKLPSLIKQPDSTSNNNLQKQYQFRNTKEGFRSRRLSSQTKANETLFLRNHQISFFRQRSITLEKDVKMSLGLKTGKKNIFEDGYLGNSQNLFQRNPKTKQPFPNQPYFFQDNLYRPKLQTKGTSIESNFQKDEDQEDELFEYLRVLQNNADLNEEFCYMNRGEKPYSFYIIDYEKRNPKEYLTVSLRGVTHYKTEGNETHHEFFTIKSFRKDIRRYKTLKKIQFFKKYLLQKALNHWKLAMVNNMFQSQCRFLIENLLSQNKVNQRYFQELHSLCHKHSCPNILGFQITEALPSLRQLRQDFMVRAKENIKKNCEQFEDQIRRKLVLCLEENMRIFRIEKRIYLGSTDRNENSESFLPFDNQRRSMKFTQLAKLKQFERYLYKVIRYTDMVRYNLKIEQVRNALINARIEMDSVYQNYLKRDSRAFVSWVQCKAQVGIIKGKEQQVMARSELPVYDRNQQSSKVLSNQFNLTEIPNQTFNHNQYQQRLQSSIIFSPSIDEIKRQIIEHKERCIKQWWQSYFFLFQEKNQLFCQLVEMQDELPLKLDLKYFIINSPQLIHLNDSFQASLSQILHSLQHQKHSLQSSLLNIYQDSFLNEPLQNYLQNQKLKTYLATYLINKQTIETTEQYIEFGLVILNLSFLKLQVKKVFEDKYKTIVTAIPQEIIKRAQRVTHQVTELYVKFKQNPNTIREFIDFYRNFHSLKSKLSLFQQRIQDLMELQTIVLDNGIKMTDNCRVTIAETQALFRDLEKRFEQIDLNEEKQQKRFQIILDQIIPLIQQKAQNLLKQITLSYQINNPESPVSTVEQKIQEFDLKLLKIRQKKQELFRYQEELKLGHKDVQNYFKLEDVFQWYKKIWSGYQELLQFQKIIQQKGYGQVENINTLPLIRYSQDIDVAFNSIEAVDLLQKFKTRTKRVIHVIKLSKLMSTYTFQEEHCQKIQSIMVFNLKKIKDLIFTRQGNKTITCQDLYLNTNVSQIQTELQEIAFLSSRENAIKKDLNAVEDFWKKNKLNFKTQDIIKNGTLIMRLDSNEDLQQKIGFYYLNLNNIQKSAQAKGAVLQRLLIQIKVTKYVSDLLQIWAKVQKQWLKLLPLMFNCPSIKHQSNVFYEFSGVDSAMRKIIKQVSDMSSMRRLIQDQEEKKYINILLKCKLELEEINLTLSKFLQTKRSLYSRFSFLTDQELINIIENVKDSKSLVRFGGYCFNCDKLEMQNELISGMSSQYETLRLRKVMLRGEPEEMFKSIEQNMKGSLRLSIKGLVPRMKVGSNIEEQLKENCLQVCLLGDLIWWTQISQSYLCGDSYEVYLMIMRSLHGQMAALLPVIGRDLWMKLSVRLTQMNSLKDESESLIVEQATRDSFKWKSVLKFYLQEEDICIRQFGFELSHGFEYYPPSSIFVATQNTESLLRQMYYACLHYKVLNVSGPEGHSKRTLIKNTASRLGIYSREVICNHNLSINYFQRLLQGALLSNAWLTFYESYNLKPQVTSQLLQRIDSLINLQNPHPNTLFILINHNQHSHQHYHPVNVFKYHNYTLVEPDHKHISNYLLQIYCFRDWAQLSNQLLSYIKTIHPLIKNVIGTPLSLIRRIIIAAGAIKLTSSSTEDQTQILVQTIQKQIIKKIDDKVAILLKKALVGYFNIQIPFTDPKFKYIQKIEIFKQTLTRKDTRNILAIGGRCCKSTLIAEAISSLKLESIKLFPQSQKKYLTPYSIEQLNSIPEEKVLVYDGDHVIPEFVDIITTGYLLVDGRKLLIKPKIVVQLRNLQNCAPSFTSNCQIIYIGNIVSKWEKFLKYCPLQPNDTIHQIIIQNFGHDLIKLSDEHIQMFAKLINRSKTFYKTVSISKLIAWVMSVVHGEDLWQKNYNGKYSDLTINQKDLQLSTIDLSSKSSLQYLDSNFYFIPTKTSILTIDFVTCLLAEGLHVQVYGEQNIGKSALLNFFKSPKTIFSVHHETEFWAQKLKSRLLTVRKEGKNFLIPVGDLQFRVYVDDLDLGQRSHQSFLRSLIQSSEIIDSKYQRYFLETFNLVVTSRSKNFGNKFDECLVKIPLINQSKENMNTIYLSNINQFAEKNNFNRQVIDYMNATVLKILLIIFDDFANIYGCNMAFSQVISLIKDLVSIPKKNAFISLGQFTSLFKSLSYQKLTERSVNKKQREQLNYVFDNIAKIFFDNQKQTDHWVNIQGHFRQTTKEFIQSLIKSEFKRLIFYPQLDEKVIYLSNQLQSINSKIVIIGRKGVGKRSLIKIVSWLNKLETVETIKDAICKALKKQDCILIEEIKPNKKSFFCQLRDCQIDKDLEDFVDISMKQKLREQMNLSDGVDSTIILNRIKKYIKFAFLLDDKKTYFLLSNQIRELADFSVCFMDEWPIQAIMNLYKTSDENENHHAELFTKSNNVLLKNQLNCMSMAFYGKYARVFSKIYLQKKETLQSKQQSLRKMYFKFNESCTTIRGWQTQVNSLELGIKETIQDLTKQIQTEKTHSLVLFAIKKQVDEKQSIIKFKKNNLENSKKQLQKELKNTEKVLEKIQKIINSLKRTEMSELKKIYKTNKLVEFGLQCLCILLKQKQEDINQKTINKLLADSNLLMKMKSPHLLESKDGDFIEKFRKEMASYQFLLKTHTTQTTKILVQWIKSIIEYWETTDYYKVKQKEFQVLQAQYNQVNTDFLLIKQKLNTLNKRSNQIAQQIHKLEQIKLTKEKQLCTIKKCLENSSDMIPILLKTQEQMSIQMNKVHLMIKNLLGNCMLVAFIAAYLPLRPVNVKDKLIKTVKSYLNENSILFSESYIEEVIQENLMNRNWVEGQSDFQSLNLFLLQSLPSEVRVVVDPQRKFFSFLQSNELHNSNDIFRQIIQKAEQLTDSQFQNSNIYHSASERLLISHENYLIIDWKSTQIKPEQKLFNKIALSKKPQYFETKNVLKFKLQQNLKLIENMKNNLYEVICKSPLKILEDQKFLQNGKKLIALQQENTKLEKEIARKIELIHELSDNIKIEVGRIVILLRILRILRPIGQDLILQVATMQGNSTQNVLSWALANLPEQQRLGFTYEFANQLTGKKHEQLIREVIVNSPLRPNELKIKKPLLLNSYSWQKIVKIATYSSKLKQIPQLSLKHQKQLQIWINNAQPLLNPILLPQFLSINEHLFIIHHLKPHLFPVAVEKLTNDVLKYYQLKPMISDTLLKAMSSSTPIIYHGQISKLQRLCEKLNSSRMKKTRISGVRTFNDMVKIIEKCLKDEQWLIIYGILSDEDIEWLQKIVEYISTINHPKNFRIIVPDLPSRDEQQHNYILTSKYLESISVHIYDSIANFQDLIHQYPFQPETESNKLSPLSTDPQGDILKITSKVKSRRLSFKESHQNKLISLFKLDQLTHSNTNSQNTKQQLLTQISQQNSEQFLINKNYKFIQTLYKHIILAFLVILKRFKRKIGDNTLQILKRWIQTLKYIKQSAVTIEQNVYEVVNYLSKNWFAEVELKDRRCVEELMNRIVDQSKFNQKVIFGVDISIFSNLDNQLINNHQIFGVQNSFFIRQSQITGRYFLKTLHILLNKQNFTSQVSFIKTYLINIPHPLSNKEIKNLNYLSFYLKQQSLHNQQIKKTHDLLNQINIYEGKQQTSKQIDDESNWENLLMIVQDLVGYRFDKNFIRNVFSNYMVKLRRTHEFLLYFNPCCLNLIVNPVLVRNMEELIGVNMINYIETNNIRDAYNYIQQIEFRRIWNNQQLQQLMLQQGMEGIVLKDLRSRDFRWNYEQEEIQSLNNELQFEEKSPLVLLKVNKLPTSIKQEQQVKIELQIRQKYRYRSKNYQKLLFTSSMNSSSIFPEYYLRDNCLIAQHELLQ